MSSISGGCGIVKTNKMIFRILTLLVVEYFFEIKEVLSQSFVGKYSYSTGYHFYESLELFPNGTFIYNLNGEFLRRECKGNWQIRGQDLILDSSPQKDKIICFEFRKGRKVYTYFNVKSKSDGRAIDYHLYLIKNSGDTVELRDQFERSKIRAKDFKGFFIVGTNGTQSPTYLIQGKATNWFDILFETKRVFDNENWRITETGIQPRNNAGEYEAFLLRKDEED